MSDDRKQAERRIGLARLWARAKQIVTTDPTGSDEDDHVVDEEAARVLASNAGRLKGGLAKVAQLAAYDPGATLGGRTGATAAARAMLGGLWDRAPAVSVASISKVIEEDLGKAPPALMNNLTHNKVLHKLTIIVSVDTTDEPRVAPERRSEVTRVEPGVYQVLLNYGFMEDPDVPAALAALEMRGLTYDPDDVTYFIGRESVVAGKAPGMNPVFEHLFVLLNRGADSAVRFFNLPDEQVFEVGSRVEI